MSTDDEANTAPKARWLGIVVDSLRKAKAEPRRMMPTAAIVSGTKSTLMMRAKASGKHVHSTTSTKISQTWLASHTGPMTFSMSRRWPAPFSGPPARRSQKPAPKSAPANTAYIVRPSHSTATTASVSISAPPPAPGRAPARHRLLRGRVGWQPRPTHGAARRRTATVATVSAVYTTSRPK